MRLFCQLHDNLGEGYNTIYLANVNVSYKDYDIVISNIPYNITKDLIVHLLISARNVTQFVFMCQKENFYHFYDTKGSEYGASSVLVHLLGDIKKAFDVNASSFVPMPKCKSTVFTITRNNNYDFDLVVKTYKVASKLFLNRRKTILNNLCNLINKEEAIKILETLNIDAILRPEEISPENFYHLTTLLIEKGYKNV